MEYREAGAQPNEHEESNSERLKRALEIFYPPNGVSKKIERKGIALLAFIFGDPLRLDIRISGEDDDGNYHEHFVLTYPIRIQQKHFNNKGPQDEFAPWFKSSLAKQLKKGLRVSEKRLNGNHKE